jgi:hypothetical protein
MQENTSMPSPLQAGVAKIGKVGGNLLVPLHPITTQEEVQTYARFVHNDAYEGVVAADVFSAATPAGFAHVP